MAKKMEKKSPVIVLFEDDPQARIRRCQQIQSALPAHVQVVPFEDEDSAVRQDEALEDRLTACLKDNPQFNKGVIGLIVCDRSLDRYRKFQVASETVVSAAARSLGIPICLYERAANSFGLTLKQRKPWEKGEMIIDAESPAFGEECAAIYCGFQSISQKLANMTTSAFRKKTPSEILALILEKPEESDHIALYGAGEQSLLEELMPFYDPVKDVNTVQLKNRYYPRVLGNWLFSSILRFPGILVNELAAGSLLNIDPLDLRKKSAVRKLFKSAEYRGPFAYDGCNWRWWWRSDLEYILRQAGSESGFEFAHKNKVRGLKECKCCEGNDHPAGSVCMISEKPVCVKHSHGGISWFPGGADLARVHTRVYDKIGPFLGLY